eukprot:5697077-Karenia_brevis.AAC.1
MAFPGAHGSKPAPQDQVLSTSCGFVAKEAWDSPRVHQNGFLKAPKDAWDNPRLHQKRLSEDSPG